MQVQFPSCPIRCLIIHQYAPGIKKAGSQPCQITNIGKRGKAENNKGLSKFNNAYVEKITKLRFLAGVGTQKPSQSFFSGLSAAMAKVCPEVW